MRGKRGERGEQGPRGEQGLPGDPYDLHGGPSKSRYVNGPSSRAMKWLKLHPWTVLALLVFVSIAGTFYVGQQRAADNERLQREQIARSAESRKELCDSIDADHNRERQAIVEQTRQTLSKFPHGLDFGGIHYTAEFIYRNAKHNYAQPRKTRPNFCESVVSNPVPPFPSQKELSQPAPKRSKARSRPKD